MPDVSFNGQTAASQSWYIDGLDEGWWGLPVLDRELTRPVVGVAGVQIAGGISTPARTIRVTGRIVTSANTVAARVAAEAYWRDLFGNNGLVQVVVDDGVSPTRMTWAFAERVQIKPIGHPLLATVSEMEARLVSPEASWQALSGTAIAVPTANVKVALPLGTAPSAPIIRVMGAATTPTIYIGDAGGIIRVQLACPTLNVTNDYLDLDMQRLVFTKYASGTPSTPTITVPTGYLPVALDPAWGDPNTSQWPTIEITSGTAEVLYTKRYW